MGKVFPRGIAGKKVTELGVVHVIGSHVELPLLSGGKRNFTMVAFRVIADGLEEIISAGADDESLHVVFDGGKGFFLRFAGIAVHLPRDGRKG